MTIRLNEVIPWGRSFEKYRGMFALADDDLAGRILGCGDDWPEDPPAPTRSEAAR